MKGVPTPVAASLMGKSEDALRWAIKDQRIPDCWASQTAIGRWTYFVSPTQLAKATGLSLEEIQEAVSEYRAKLKERGKK